MANRAARIRIYERDGQVSAVQWKFHDIDPITSQPYRKENVWRREDYEQWANTRHGLKLSFDDFAKVFKTFMMGKHATRTEIPEVFHILDQDRSDSIDAYELAVFLQFSVPNYNWDMISRQLRKVHEYNNGTLNLTGFTNFIIQDLGAEMILGRN